MSAADTDPQRICVLIPVFDSERTIAGVVDAAATHCPVLVVDDGSRDGTAAQLATLDAEVVTHAHNRGKGAALRTGAARALELGFTHAITLDADGQHDPADIPKFVAAIRSAPTRLWHGHREFAGSGASLVPRLGRFFSNLTVWSQTGRWFADTQTGFRAYPLALFATTHLTTTSYDCESELLVKALWRGRDVGVVPIRVRYFRGAERISHVRPVVDFWRIFWLNTRLATLRCCLPGDYLAERSGREFAALPARERWRRTSRATAGRVVTAAAILAAAAYAPWLGVVVAVTCLAWRGLTRRPAVAGATC